MTRHFQSVCASLVLASAIVFASTPALEQKSFIVSEEVGKSIDKIVVKSPCREGPFKASEEDRAPKAFLSGMGRMYLKSYCELALHPNATVRTMAKKVGPKPADVLAYYGRPFANNNVNLTTQADRLRALYTVSISVGINESNGNPSEGPYIKNKPVQAEAGLFQMSYDSLDNRETRDWSPLLHNIYDYYQVNRRLCALDIFSKGIPNEKAPIVGEGDPAVFQKFSKDCPAFATEYAMIILRIRAQYFGTVIGTNPNGKANTALFVPACYAMFKRIESVVDCRK